MRPAKHKITNTGRHAFEVTLRPGTVTMKLRPNESHTGEIEAVKLSHQSASFSCEPAEE